MDVHDPRRPSARAAAAACGAESMGSAHRARASRPRRERLAGRDAGRSRRGSGDGRTAGARRRTLDRSARRRARQRGQPVSALAAAFVRRPGRPPGLDRRHPGRRHLRALGARGSPPRRRRRPWTAGAVGTRPGAGPRRILPGGASRAARVRGAVHRRRQRAAPYRGDEHGADRRRVWTDAAGAVRAVAGSIAGDRIGRGDRPALPSVRSARVRPG